MPNVTTYSTQEPKYLLLQPKHSPARAGVPLYQQQVTTLDNLFTHINEALDSEILAVDFETEGNDYSDPSFRIVGVGLAYDLGSCYIPADAFESHVVAKMLERISEHKGLIAHNVYFDGGVFFGSFTKHPKWKACTYALLASLANESPEQKWGLKNAMVDLLQWPDANTGDLDAWLVANGHTKGTTGKPDHSKMHLAPQDILGKYCILDAEATYLLYTEILQPAAHEFPGLVEQHQEFLHMIKILIEQKYVGIHTNRLGLQERLTHLTTEISAIDSQFMNHEQINTYIREIEKEKLRELLEKEPLVFKKNGDISKNHINWAQRVEDARAGKNPDYLFNVQSGPDLRNLLYTKLGFPIRVESETGQAGVSVKALQGMGEVGKLLIDRAYLLKEQGYIQKYLELTETRPTIHPSFRTPGTVTGRLSSKEPNLQQMPKSQAVMSLFVAPPGKQWVDIDFAALEPMVTTEASGDRNMFKIYGPDAPVNDLYLYVGAHIPGMAEKIRATGYDPHNPTREGLNRAKKECKHERSVCKTVALACAYGAGVNKIMQTLELDGMDISYEEVRNIHEGYWNLFAGVRDFNKSLDYEWKRNKGYILNGVGRPMAVPESYKKDLLNRYIQSTGHDILIKYVRILTNLLDANEVNWKPVIIDFHDSTAVEVYEQDAQKTTEIMLDAMEILNCELGTSVRFRGIPTVGRSLADIKEPEE